MLNWVSLTSSRRGRTRQTLKASALGPGDSAHCAHYLMLPDAAGRYWHDLPQDERDTHQQQQQQQGSSSPEEVDEADATARGGEADAATLSTLFRFPPCHFHLVRCLLFTLAFV